MSQEVWGVFGASAPSSGLEGNRTRRQESEGGAALSRNISMILEDLLKNYEKTERPPQDKGEVTTVRVNMLIRSMGPISETDMFYSMDCYFRQYWRDNRLSFKGLKQTANNVIINQLSLNVK